MLKNSGKTSFVHTKIQQNPYKNNNTYNITNTSAKYYISTQWTDGAYNKTASGSVLLSTGASSEFNKAGIYDLAGNVYEWTLEYTSISVGPCATRGGSFDSDCHDYRYHTENHQKYTG